VKLVTAAEMRGIEHAAGETGLDIPTLIERAGRAVDEVVQAMVPAGPVAVLAGPGNNGADGLTAARRMLGRGEQVRVYTFRRRDLGSYIGPAVAAESDADAHALRRLLDDCSVVVDALLGTGQSRPVEGPLARILETISEDQFARLSRLAVDVPTGIDADSGRVLGVAFRTDVTVCMGFPKRGSVIYPGAEYSGRLEIRSLGIDPGLAGSVQVNINGDDEIHRLLPQRPPDGNKGSSGRLLSIGGSSDFVGAPSLVAVAAYRTGAGLVESAIPASIRDAVSSHGLEPVYRLLPEARGKLAPEAATVLAEAAKRARAVVVGPGMGLSDSTVELMRRLQPELLEAQARAVLIDADGLNALARLDRWWETKLPRVLTPHPGEMARLTGKSIAEIQSDRIGAAREHAARWNSVVVLKGAGTVVARPDGETVVNTTGGPNLATAGTGDVLSGIIGGLLAQGCSPYDAATAGVYIHGRAGDIVRARLGNVGTVASDLLDVIAAARLSLEEGVAEQQ
jgi:NAD(P)H-hydrate epimerase